MQTGFGVGDALVGFNPNEHPAPSPLNGHKQVTAFVVVLYLGRVLRIHVSIASCIGFKRFVCLLELFRFKRFVLSTSRRRKHPSRPVPETVSQMNSYVTKEGHLKATKSGGEVYNHH